MKAFIIVIGASPPNEKLKVNTFPGTQGTQFMPRLLQGRRCQLCSRKRCSRGLGSKGWVRLSHESQPLVSQDVSQQPGRFGAEGGPATVVSPGTASGFSTCPEAGVPSSQRGGAHPAPFKRRWAAVGRMLLHLLDV